MKTLLHCTNGKPWLVYKHSGLYETIKSSNVPLGNLNGTVCFACDIDEVEELDMRRCDMRNYWYPKRACVSVEAMEKYAKVKEVGTGIVYLKNLYALYLTNVKAIKPMPIFKLMTDTNKLDEIEKTHMIAPSLKRAPQNMCYAWWFNPETRKQERVLVISVHPQNLCNIANGVKDIETRRVIVNGLKELIK